MCTEEIRMLQTLNTIKSMGITATTLRDNPALYNASAETMLACARIYLRRSAASVSEPVDHFANDAVMDMLRHMDRLLSLPAEERLPYFRASAKNVFLRHLAHDRNIQKYQFQEETRVTPANTEELVLRRELVATLMEQAARALTLREFCAFFYVRVIGVSPGELAALLQSYRQTDLVRNLIRQLCDLYRISPAVFAPILEKKERKGGTNPRSITQAAQRGDGKIRKIFQSL